MSLSNLPNIMTLKNLLSNRNVDELKKLAALLGKGIPARKADIIDFITTRLFDNLEEIVSKLKPLEVKALAEAIHNWNGTLHYQRFQAKYDGYLFGEDEKSSGRFNRYERKPRLIELFFLNRCIPDDLRERLEPFIPPPKTEKITYTTLPKGEMIRHDEMELTVRETAHAALINLNTLLTWIMEGNIKVSEKTGRATAATIKKISAELYDGDFYDDDDDDEVGPMQAFAWPLLLQGGGLAKADGKALTLSRKGTAAMKKELADAIKTIFQQWEKTKLIDEYSRVSAVKGQKAAKGRAMTSPIHRRPVINLALARLEPGKWVAMDEMNRFMASEDYTFSMINLDWKLYFGTLEYGALAYFDSRSLLNFRYLLIYFFEYCATLGLLDVAYQHPTDARPDYRSCWGAEDEPYLSHCDGLMYIRLNDLGAYVLGLSSAYKPLEEDAYVIEAADILFQGKGIPSPEQTLQLDKFAVQQEQNRWRITLDSLMNAVKAGETIKGIDTFITALTGQKEKNEIDALLKQVERRSNAVVKKGEVTLLECHMEIRKQILTDKTLSRLCLPAGERHIVILPEKDEAFAAALEGLGVIVGS